MTISTQDSKVNYQGNGQTTVFQIPFPFLENNQIYVQKKDAQGNLINYTYATDYTVTGAGEENGGSVTLNVAPEQGSTISIYRDVPLTQEVDYRENEIFPAETHEEALDKLTMEVQQIQEQLDRSFKVDRFSDVDLDSVINEIERVYDSTDNIDIVANNINDVNTVADNIANVNTVAGDIDSVVTTATNINDVKTVAQNKASLNITAANITDVKTVSSIKDDVPTVANNSANITTVATNISDVNTAASNIAAIQDAPNQAASAQNSATQAAQSAQTAEDKADEASESARLAVSALSLQIGDVCFVPLGIDESLNLRRYLNGQVLIQSQFVAFTNKVKSAIALYPNLATTEANWQAEKTNSKFGQCGKFVVDDAAGTIRLPAVVNVQGLLSLSGIGNLVNESLPNITGKVNIPVYNPWVEVVEGAFSKDEIKHQMDNGNDGNFGTLVLKFNASNSSSTYQDNAPVQQEAVQYPYCIVVNTGVEETLPAIREYEINTPFFFGQSMYSDVAPDNASWLVSNGQYNAKTVYPDYYDWLLEQMNAGVSGFVASTSAYTDYDFVINTTDQTFRLPLLNGEEDLPGNTFGSMTYTGHGSTYTAQKNGHFSLYGYGSTGYIWLHNLTSYSYSDCLGSTEQSSPCGVSIKCKKGDTIQAGYYNGTITTFGFTPSIGNGTLYYYVGDTVQDASLINAGAVLGQLSNKADIDASNFNTDGKSLLSGLSMPSGRYIDLTLGASGQTYTAPANGWFVLHKAANNVGQYVYMHTIGVDMGTCFNVSSGTDIPSYFLPVKAGDIVEIDYTLGGATKQFRFIYAEGENNV